MANGLVGRGRELAWLRAAAGPVPDARPRLVVVEGEAGIGKTRLVQAFADGLATPVRWAQGVEEGGPPFWLWSRLVPEVRPDATADRFTLFGELRAALASDGGLLLVVDDVQWADEPSLLLLRMLLRDPGCRGLACVATRRTGETGLGWERVGPDLLGGTDVERLDLRGLDDGAAVELLTAAAGRDPTADESARATLAAAGNPLFLRELGRLLASGARASGDGIAGVITARIRRLDPSAQELLRAAALLAETFELAVAARLVDRPTAACLPAVGQALSAGLLDESGSGRFRFAHGLVRTVLAEQIPLQESVVLHLRAAEAVEDLHRHDLARVSADVARHRIAVAVAGDRRPAVDWARRAGDDATRALAHEEAARLYGAALSCGGDILEAGERAEILVARAGAQIAAGRFSEAFDDCGQAVDLAGGAGREDLVASAALTLDAVGNQAWDRTLQAWCERALETVTAGPRHSRLQARLAEVRYYGGDRAGADAPAARALETAGEDGNALVAALRARQLLCTGPDHSDERADLAGRMTALGAQLRRPDVQMWGHLWAIDVRWEHGDLTGIETELTLLRWCVGRVRSPLAGWHLLVGRAALAQARGELAAAVELADEAFRLVAGTGHPAAHGARLALLGAVGHHSGPPPDTFGPPGSAADVGEPRESLFARLGPAEALAATGRLDDAAHLYGLTGPPRDWDVPPYFELPAFTVGARIAIALDRRDDVAWFRSMLEERRSGHLVGGGGVASYSGPVDLVLGTCAAALDDVDDAVELLSSALATCERIGAPGFAVEAMVELATVRLRRRESDAARALLNRARPTAERLGMARWVSRIDALAGADAGPLTAREQEVAGLVALGRSNREIAEQLVLSERTVGNHVQHVLGKLGFARRGQIAAWVTARMSTPSSTSPDVTGRRRP
ncbi:ATP-binding protein [Pseudonocardia endophytica]|uniref:AAA ATPase-like protein n=1 Tax=Pseudonocardia endophytica TaxID=401976 RepID=A0A4R1HYI9_PSEEN|nr:AAA family ATPase [Pseudonocardia endophytica]TCK27867.1 AAA ATPase-like protein [Pseudonocardia endophytica]